MMLLEKYLKKFDYFNPLLVSKLIAKAKSGSNFSEIENMSLAGILSTQLIHYFFVERNLDLLDSSKLNNLRIIER